MLACLQAYGHLAHKHEPLLSALAQHVASSDPVTLTCDVLSESLNAFAILGFTDQAALRAARAIILWRCARTDKGECFTAQQ
jgi:hypothetical protein